MTFDKNKQRQFKVKVMNIQAGRETIVGEWNGRELVIDRNEKEINNTLTEAAQNKIFKVTTRVVSTMKDHLLF